MSDYGPPPDLYDERAEPHPDELRDLLRLVRDTRKEWADLEAILEADLGMSVGVGQHDGYVVRQAADKTEWDTDGVKRRIVAEAGRGSEDHEPEDVERLVAAIWECVPKNPAWRIGGLKALGIDASDYRTRLPGRFTVQLTDSREAED